MLNFIEKWRNIYGKDEFYTKQVQVIMYIM